VCPWGTIYAYQRKGHLGMRPVMLMEKLEPAYNYYCAPEATRAHKIDAVVTFLTTICHSSVSGVQCEDMKAENLAVCTTGPVPVLKIIDLEQIVVPRSLPGNHAGVSTYRALNWQSSSTSIRETLTHRARLTPVPQECTKMAVDYERIVLSVIAVFDLVKNLLDRRDRMVQYFLASLQRLKAWMKTKRFSKLDRNSRGNALDDVYRKFQECFNPQRPDDMKLLHGLQTSIMKAKTIADNICTRTGIDRETFAQFAHPHADA
jgi:hypothetical protein